MSAFELLKAAVVVVAAAAAAADVGSVADLGDNC